MSKVLKAFGRSLFDPKLVPTALKVALIVGTVLLLINHGHALLQGQMTRDRWVSAHLSYFVPYVVNIHGQFISLSRKGL